MHTPSNFIVAPGHNSFRPEPVGAATPVGQYVAPPAFVPPAPAMPTLTLTPQPKQPGLYRAALHQALVGALGLRNGQRAALHPPVYGSAFWYLDLRSQAAQRISWYADSRPRIECIPLPELVVPLTLALLYEHPDYEDIYCLLPHAQPAPR